MRRRQRRQVIEEALQAFQASSVRRPSPKAAVIEPGFEPKPRRLTWSERAHDELEVAMELDLEPERRQRRPHTPIYERVAEHLKEKGFS